MYALDSNASNVGIFIWKPCCLAATPMDNIDNEGFIFQCTKWNFNCCIMGVVDVAPIADNGDCFYTFYPKGL